MVEPELRDGFAVSGRRRRRSAQQRRQIVEETLAAGSSVASVARKYGINANQLFQWRRLYRRGHLGGEPEGCVNLLPVMVSEDMRESVSAVGTGVTPPVGAIHIELPGRVLIRLEGSVDPAVVRAVVESLRA